VHKGRVFSAPWTRSFRTPPSEAVVEQIDRLGARRAFLMVSGTLNRETLKSTRSARRLAPVCAATFDAMPPHTPRQAVIAAAEQARAVNADLIVTVGGGRSPTAPRLCSFASPNTFARSRASTRSAAIKGTAPDITAPTVRQISVPTTIAGGEFSAIAGVTDERARSRKRCA